jgi:hypothetical protein
MYFRHNDPLHPIQRDASIGTESLVISLNNATDRNRRFKIPELTNVKQIHLDRVVVIWGNNPVQNIITLDISTDDRSLTNLLRNDALTAKMPIFLKSFGLAPNVVSYSNLEIEESILFNDKIGSIILKQLSVIPLDQTGTGEFLFSEIWLWFTIFHQKWSTVGIGKGQ